MQACVCVYVCVCVCVCECVCVCVCACSLQQTRHRLSNSFSCGSALGDVIIMTILNVVINNVSP
jgi:hypothetical protein